MREYVSWQRVLRIETFWKLGPPEHAVMKRGAVLTRVCVASRPIGQQNYINVAKTAMRARQPGLIRPRVLLCCQRSSTPFPRTLAY